MSAIARAAGVDRTFLYRHADLLGQVHATQANPAAAQGDGPTVSRASLQADLANAQGQATRQAARIRQLETKLSQTTRRAGLAGVRAPRPTSTSSNAGSPNWNSRWSTCAARSRNATRNSTPHGPPTGNSSPTSTGEPDPATRAYPRAAGSSSPRQSETPNRNRPPRRLHTRQVQLGTSCPSREIATKERTAFPRSRANLVTEPSPRTEELRWATVGPGCS